MEGDRIEDLKKYEHMQKLFAAIEYLKNLDASELSTEEYDVIEELIVKLYVQKKVAKALDDILRPALFDLVTTVERASALRREAMDHVSRVSSQSGAARRTNRSFASN